MLAAGSSAIVAIKLGEGKTSEACEKFTLICIFTVSIGVVVAVLGIVFLDELLIMLGATERLWPYCTDYAWIIIFALPAAFLGVLLEYFIRVDGKPGFTLVLYISGGVVHILLDYVFIVLCGWGIKGSGFATAIGQLTVVLMGIGYFVTCDTKLHLLISKWDWKYIKNCIFNGFAEMVTESSVAITVYVFNILVINLVGENGLAALGIVFNVNYLLISIHLGFITGISPLISYYYGAQEYDKVNQFLKYSKIFIIASSVMVSFLAAAEAPLLARVFVEPGTEVYHFAVRGIRLLSGSFLFTGINVFASGFFISYANGIVSTIISITRGLIMVLIGAAVLPYFFGLDGAWLTPVFAEITTFFLTMAMFKKYKNRYHYVF